MHTAKLSLAALISFSALISHAPAASQSLADLNLGQISQNHGDPKKNQSIDGRPLTIAGKTFQTGVGSHAAHEIIILLDGKTDRFTASVGLDDETLPDKGSAEFFAAVDGKVAWKSGVMRTGDSAKPVNLSLKGAKTLVLFATESGDDDKYDHTNWVDAKFDFQGTAPAIITSPVEERVVLTPPASPKPRINGAKTYGARPGSPILYKFAVSGQKPMKYSVDSLPGGLSLDPNTGVLTGSISEEGTYNMNFTASNAVGEASRKFTLVIGDTLALTPPMGWNSWNVFGTQVDQEKVLSAAKAMVDSGLIDYGWSFVNLDDAWTNAPASKAPLISGPSRNDDGTIVVNKKFPDMKGMVDAIHAMGLKAGIYSSPGPLNCGGFVGSFGFERQDAEQYAEWGIDYLKYDWCGYERISQVLTADWRIDKFSWLNLQSPYRKMQGYLEALPRDIVYSLCQYGMGDVWKWGGSVGGNLWRTTGDIHDSWKSMSGIGFNQAGLEKYSGPGRWNDPDMLVVGKVGMQGNFWNHEYNKPNLYESRLTPNEQYTHITLWTMLAAPLLIGCDMTQMDDFTKGLLTNSEVIDINQDPLGQQARLVSREGFVEVWARPLEDGSVAIALFNRGPLPTLVTADLKACGVTGENLTVRDVWRQKDIGAAASTYEAEIPRHGSALVRVYKK